MNLADATTVLADNREQAVATLEQLTRLARDQNQLVFQPHLEQTERQIEQLDAIVAELARRSRRGRHLPRLAGDLHRARPAGHPVPAGRRRHPAVHRRRLRPGLRLVPARAHGAGAVSKRHPRQPRRCSSPSSSSCACGRCATSSPSTPSRTRTRSSVDLAAASGLAANAEVAYLGVQLRPGRRASSSSTAASEPTLKIDDDRRIPEGSIARIFRKSAIGEPYIDFQPPADFDFDDGDYYARRRRRPGRGHHAPRSSSPSCCARPAGSSPPSTPNGRRRCSTSSRSGLEGRGDDLRTLTEASDTLASTFAERTDALDRLATNNTRLTAVLTDHRGSLGQSLTDLADLAESLRAAGGDTRVLLDRGTALLAEVGDLVHDSQPELDCLLDNLVAVNDRGCAAGPPERPRPPPRDRSGRLRHARVDARDIEPDGPWVRVNLMMSPGTARPARPAPRPARRSPTCPSAVRCAARPAPLRRRPATSGVEDVLVEPRPERGLRCRSGRRGSLRRDGRRPRSPWLAVRRFRRAA